MSNTNYESLGLTKGASKLNVKQAYMRLHPNKGGNTAGFQSRRNAYERIMRSLEIMAAAEARNKAKNNGRRKNVSGAVGSAVAHNVNEFFRRKNVVAVVPRKGNQPAVGLAPATNNSNPLAIVPYKNKPHEVVPIPAKIEKKLPGVNAGTNARPVGVSVGSGPNAPPPAQPGKPSFWNRFKRPSMPSFGRPSMPSFGFGGLFKSARQKAINAGNFMPSNAFNGAKNGYEYKTNRHGRGYYRLGSFYAKNPIKGLPAMGPVGPVAIGFPVPNNGNKGHKNMITGNNGTGNGGGGRGGGAPTAQQRLHPGYQFGQNEWFHQVVIGAGLQARHPIVHRAAGREHTHRHVVVHRA
jgi:hypothetical protein